MCGHAVFSSRHVSQQDPESEGLESCSEAVVNSDYVTLTNV